MNLSKQQIKEALKTNNEITYPIYLTLQEIMVAEDALFERSSVLSAIADMNVYHKRNDKGDSLDKKVILLERIAKKIAMPLDEMYMANDSLEMV